jgi:hypothetical protein
MKLLSAALLALSVVAAAVPQVSAATYTVSGSTITKTCYKNVYVPATIQVKTNGTLVAPSASVTIGDHTPGTVIQFTSSPEVYMETRKVLEAEHISLVPVPCP